MNFNQLFRFSIFLSTAFGQSASLDFDKQELNIGSEKHQIVLSGDLTGDSHSEITVTSKDSLNNTSLRMFSFENGQWEKTLDTELPNDVLFVDIAKLGGRQQFIFYQNSVYSRVDPTTGNIEEFLHVKFDFTKLHYLKIPWVNTSADLNGDGLDEFIIPGFDGFTIYVQLDNGTFADPVKLGPPEPYLDFVSSGDEPERTYRQWGFSAKTVPKYFSRIHLIDVNLDGRKDLVFRNKDVFDVHIQNESGLFEPIATQYKTDLTLGTDAPYSLHYQLHDEGIIGPIFGLRFPTEYTFMENFDDINGDGIADIITHTLTGRAVFKLDSRYDIYFGSETDSGLKFNVDNKSSLFPSGTSAIGEMEGYVNHWFHDFNGDGLKDLFRYDVRFSIGQIIRTLVMKTVYVDYEYFQNTENGFPKKANKKGTIKSKFDWDAGFFPAITSGDLNGDGNTEFLITTSPEEFHVFAMDSENEMFPEHPQVIFMNVPRSERNTWILDLHQDGKDDIFMYHPTKPGDNRLVILTAN